jgi:general secretion pathway protein C
MLLRVWTSVVWALVAASAAFWGLKLFVKSPGAPAGTQVTASTPPTQADLTRLLGVDAPVVVAEAVPDRRYQLLGVVAPRPAAAAREGLALIAVDGKPPRAYRVGALVDGDTVLKSVSARQATLGPRDGGSSVALDLPAPSPAATGTLPAAPGAPVVSVPAPPRFFPGRPMPQGRSPQPAAVAPPEPSSNGAATE